MTTRKLHYITGLIITLFVGLHLFNHLWALKGANSHIAWMHSLRPLYRNRLMETVLLSAVVIQVITGIKQFISYRKAGLEGFEKLQGWTGFYLAIFLVIHVSAVWAGRSVLGLDTNFYFGVAGLNTFPFNLFFIPYYGLAILSFFGHLAAVHHKKMKQTLLGCTPSIQSKAILVFGLVLTVIIFYGLTNHFKGVPIPGEYQVLIGK